MKTYTVDEAATVLKMSPRTLLDKRFRERLGLVSRKIGRRLVFTEQDLMHVLGLANDGNDELSPRSPR